MPRDSVPRRPSSGTRKPLPRREEYGAPPEAPTREYGRDRVPEPPRRTTSAAAPGGATPRTAGGGGRRTGQGGQGGSGGGGFRPPRRTSSGGSRPRVSGRTVRRGLLVALVALLVLGVAGFVTLDSKLHRIDALADYDGRPAETPGQDWLLVGSDSRKGLSAEDRKKLATGRAAGQRTDTMMLLHIPEGSGRPTLVSLPRDSYVSIPGKGRNKLNAAYTLGGPKLLARTVETVTGIRLDRYMEIGFAGFVGIVDAIGGVELCPKESIKDPKAGLNLKKGCQVMDGPTALGYVRTRATARADLDRVKRQRQFFAAVVSQATSPGVLLNPFRSVPLAFSAADAVSLDGSAHVHNLAGLAFAMGDGPITTTVPVASTPTLPGVGSVVQWDRARALRLFEALAADREVPKDVLVTN
ncbi:LytR family transcriptional regulator [Bailinhaonella thermotolerans]|uniref:LytR family transcriptional regulator n=2 Tax=Bailinhaonella thermotolerans TaxID=1070861 RepID=A0A3A4AR97_9ACTN|nr:LytR family transcriptional regulator [Bailinhaonella thermotolerans]